MKLVKLVRAKLAQMELARTELVITVIAKLHFVTPWSLPFVLNMPFRLFYTVIDVGLKYLAISVILF